MGTDEGVDRIEREILIEAPVERVWQLVSEPGWWIGDGDGAELVVTPQGDHVVVEHPRYGRFPVRTEVSEPPRYVSYRGSEPGRPIEAGSSTLVEFFLAEQDGGTLLRVVESGFAALGGSPQRRAEQLEGNTEGWEMQLGYAKRDAERGDA